MDKFLFLSILLSISAFTRGDGNINAIVSGENGVERPIKPAFKSTLSPRSQHFSERLVTPTTKTTLSPHRQHSTGSFTRIAVSSSVATVLFIFLLVCLIYYCCCRNQTPEGFTQFNNENERNPLRRRSRWKHRRFFKRNRGPNQYQNSPEAGNSTHVTVQPVLTLNISSGDSAPPPGDCRAVPSMLTTPPGYDESIKNPPIPSEFINPPIPNQFAIPHLLNQFANPPLPNQFFNPPFPSQYINPPIPSEFIDPPIFNNPSALSNFNTPSVRARL